MPPVPSAARAYRRGSSNTHAAAPTAMADMVPLVAPEFGWRKELRRRRRALPKWLGRPRQSAAAIVDDPARRPIIEEALRLGLSPHRLGARLNCDHRAAVKVLALVRAFAATASTTSLVPSGV